MQVCDSFPPISFFHLDIVSKSANWTLLQEETQINIIVFLLSNTKGDRIVSCFNKDDKGSPTQSEKSCLLINYYNTQQYFLAKLCKNNFMY